MEREGKRGKKNKVKKKRKRANGVCKRCTCATDIRNVRKREIIALLHAATSGQSIIRARVLCRDNALTRERVRRVEGALRGK